MNTLPNAQTHYKRRWLMFAIVAAALLPAAWAAQRQESPEALLQRAIQKEQVDGDPKAAIDIYKQIASLPGAGNAIKAQAWMNMGRSYEYTAPLEARIAYDQIVRDFADQQGAVEFAKLRLRALGFSSGAAGGSSNVRQIWSGGNIPSDQARVSADGLYVAYIVFHTPGNQTELFVREIATRVSWKLPGPGPGEVSSPVWSRDMRIAFVFKSGSVTEVRSVSVNGSRESRIVRFEGNLPGMQLLDWSSDGKRILAKLSANGSVQRNGEFIGRSHLMWIDVSSGKTTRLGEWPAPGTFNGVISPDGKYVAFGPTGSPERTIQIVDSMSEGESSLSSHVNDLFPVGWTRDGKNVIALTQRNGITELMALPVVNGKSAGNPMMLARVCECLLPFFPRVYGLTDKGVIYYEGEVSDSDIYTAALDPRTGMSALPTPLPVPRINEIFVRPKWAPNGKKVIFYARRYAEREFLVLPLNGGTAQRLSGLEFDPGGYCWMGNDALLIRRTSRRPIQSKLIRVDLATRSEAILMTTKDAGGILGNMTCSQDGKLVFIKQVYEVSGKLLDLNTNSETSVLLPNNLRSADVPISADGKNLLFIAGNDGAQAIFIMPTSGGKPRELLKVTGPEELQLTYGLAWSPDGRYVYFVKRANRDKDFELFRISTSEGKEEPLGLSGIDLRDLDVSPDGSRIAFSLGKLNRSEVYAVENFLPNARDSR